MLVRYEPPLHDLSYVVQAPLLLDIEGACGGWIERWSLEGVVPAPGMDLKGGNAVLTIPFNGFGISLQCRLAFDAQKNLLCFEDLGERECRVLRHFYRQLVTGRATSINHMITAMEAPLEKIPMGQTPAEAIADSKRTPPRALRAVVTIVVYAVLAVIAYQSVLLPALEIVSGEASLISRLALQ